MTAIASLSDLVNLRTGGGSAAPQNLWQFKDARIAGAAATAPIAGRLQSLWRFDGSLGPGAAPGAVAAPTNATDGCFKQTDPGGGRQLWLASFWVQCISAGSMLLYDRLLHISGLSGTNTGAQTVGGTLGRYTGGVGNMIAVEIYTIVGTTATTITASYTNQAGTSGRTTAATVFGATNNREATRMIILPLQAGDTGVQAVASVTVLATTGTAGDFGVNVIHPLAVAPVPSPGGMGSRDFALGLPGMPEVLTDACLAMAWLPVLTTIPQVMAGVELVEK